MHSFLRQLQAMSETQKPQDRACQLVAYCLTAANPRFWALLCDAEAKTEILLYLGQQAPC